MTKKSEKKQTETIRRKKQKQQIEDKKGCLTKCEHTTSSSWPNWPQTIWTNKFKNRVITLSTENSGVCKKVKIKRPPFAFSGSSQSGLISSLNSRKSEFILYASAFDKSAQRSQNCYKGEFWIFWKGGYLNRLELT